MTQEKKQEYTLKITQANKTQMITILYEMVLEYIGDAMDAMSASNRFNSSNGLSKVNLKRF